MTGPLTTPLLLRSDFTNELAASVNTTTNAAILDKIIEESARLQRWCGRRFDEQIDTRYYSPRSIAHGGDIRGLDLFLADDLRALTTLTNADGVVIASTEYRLLPRSADTNGVLTHDTVHLLTQSTVRWNTGTSDPTEAISVLGLWGYGGQWKSTGITVASGLASDINATQFTASAALEAGMTLRIGSEYLYVESISTTTTNVARAYNGSTPAVHANGAVIYRWECDPLIKRHLKRLVLISIAQDSSPLLGQLIIGDAVSAVASDGNPKDVLYDVKQAGLQRITMPLGV